MRIVVFSVPRDRHSSFSRRRWLFPPTYSPAAHNMAAFVASGAMALSSKAIAARRPAAAAAVRLPARPAARAMQVVAMAKPTTATEFRCVVA
jgi:hypothetical protein